MSSLTSYYEFCYVPVHYGDRSLRKVTFVPITSRGGFEFKVAACNSRLKEAAAEVINWFVVSGSSIHIS